MQFKLNGQYTLPWDIGVSGHYRVLQGPVIGYDYTAPTPFPLSDGSTSIQVTLARPNQEYFPLTHQLDLRFSKSFRWSDRYVFRPAVDFYNIFNSDGIRGIVSTYGDRWQEPTSVLQPRQFRITAQFQF
jgi:hypothetical protein